MDLAALTIFRAVVRENGVTRAARKLNRVQSNVTTRIRQLEEQLGTPLFVRDGRRLVLTPAGETLLPYAERLLALADEARHAVTESRPHGRLRLGTMESTAASRLPPVLANYHQRWPEVMLELTTGVTRDLIDRVRNFELDAALVARPADGDAWLDDHFDFLPIFHEELVLLTPRGHRPVRTSRDLALGPVIGPLSGPLIGPLSTLIAFERGCAYRAHAQRWYDANGLRPERVLELGSYHSIVACVAAGVGVAVAPRSVLALGTHGENIALHSLGASGAIDTLLVWRRGHRSAALDALRDALLGQEPAEAAAEAPTEARSPAEAPETGAA